MMTTTAQIQKNGNLILPANLRKRHRLKDGAPVTLIDLQEGILISPKASALPRLAAQVEKLPRKNNISLTELIQGVRLLRESES